MNILQKIVTHRKEEMKKLGPDFGCEIPAERTVPLVFFGTTPFVICELKRKSPSKGVISGDFNPVQIAGKYINSGIKNISVLTENEYFGGSLTDLISVKNKYPKIAVLRKDFLISKKEIDISFRAGADAVLLIASILDRDLLAELYKLSIMLGMRPLVEVHTKEDYKKVRDIKPELVGINSRDLTSFTIDPLLPIRIKHLLDWNPDVVYESGIKTGEDAKLASTSGFAGILVGESVVKEPEKIPQLIKGFQSPRKNNFWEKLMKRKKDNKPLIKICGITNKKDAETAAELGADILGFVFADSPRRADPGLISEIKSLAILKAAVIVSNERDIIDPEVLNLLQKGLIDVVQFHGSETPDYCYSFPYPWYKAVRAENNKALDEGSQYSCPRVLIDSYKKGQPGGTGTRIKKRILTNFNADNFLWIAGGVNPENVSEIISMYKPELIDASSGLEESHGVKSTAKLKKYFMEIKDANY